MTLIEVLLATAITAIILMTCYGIYSRVLVQQNRLESRSLLLHQTRVLTHRLGLELRSLAASPDGVKLILGVDTYGRSQLQVTTRATTMEYSGLVEVQYGLDQDKNGNLLLHRSERPAYLKEQDFEPRPLLHHVENLEFEVFDGTAWRTDWSTTGQPRGLRLKLSLSLNEETLQVGTAFDIGGS